MDRSFAARLGIGGLTDRPRGSSRPRSRGGGRRAPASHRLGGGVDRALATAWRLPLLPAHAAAAAWARVRPHRRLRIALIALLIATPLLAGGWLWLRSSSLVAVEQVRVSGLHGSDAPQIEAALNAAGRRMTTLDVDPAALRAAVAAYPVVAGVKVSTSFPHGLRIEVERAAAGRDARARRREDGRRGRRRRARRGARQQFVADACREDPVHRRASACTEPRSSRAERARRRAAAAREGRAERVQRLEGADARAPRRRSRLLRRRDASAREVGVAGARARGPVLGRRLLRRRAPARTPGCRFPCRRGAAGEQR